MFKYALYIFSGFFLIATGIAAAALSYEQWLPTLVQIRIWLEAPSIIQTRYYSLTIVGCLMLIMLMIGINIETWMKSLSLKKEKLKETVV